MTGPRSVAAVLLAAITSTGAAGVPMQQPYSCPVTVPLQPVFVPPTPYPAAPPNAAFWYGNASLWTMLPLEGQWRGSRQKSVWWHPGFDGRQQPSPDLRVTGKRIDGVHGSFEAPRATNAHHADFGGWAMLTGLDVPTPGCWEITANYRGHAVTFVVSVTP